MSELSDLRDAITKLTSTINTGKGGGGAGVGFEAGAGAAVAGTDAARLWSGFRKEQTELDGQLALDHKKKAKEKESFDLLSGFNKIIGLATGGIIASGLQNTVEGNQLQRSLGMIAYELADLVRGPIRLLIQELYGFANVVHHLNDEVNVGPKYGREHSLVHNLLGSNPDYNRGTTLGKFWNWATGNKDQNLIPGYMTGDEKPSKPKYDPLQDSSHLKPMYQTTFAGLTSLWESLQAKVTENPMLDGQRRGLSILEKIYNAIVRIPGVGGEAIPEHDLFGGT